MTLLTIGIPIYNGQDTVGDTLDSLCSQINKDIANDIEILISDNASNDDSDKIISKYIKQYPKIFSYYKNKKNIGYDKNVDNVFKKSKGQFVWIFACDDVSKQNSISYILKTIKNNTDVSVFLINFEIYNNDLSKLAHVDYTNNKKDAIYKDYRNFLYRSNSKYGLVSSLIFLKDSWNSIDVSTGYGFQYIHIFVLLSILPKIKSAYIIDTPLFCARLGSSNFQKSPDDNILIPLGAIKLLKLIRSSTNFDHKCYKFLLKNQRKYVFSSIKSSINLGMKNKFFVFKELVKYNYDSPIFWLRYAVKFLRKKRKCNNIPSK